MADEKHFPVFKFTEQGLARDALDLLRQENMQAY